MNWLHMSCEVFVVVIIQIALSRPFSLPPVGLNDHLPCNFLGNNPTNSSPYILEPWRWSIMSRWKTSIHLQDYMVSHYMKSNVSNKSSRKNEMYISCPVNFSMGNWKWSSRIVILCMHFLSCSFHYMRSEVLTVISNAIAVFWDVMLCSIVLYSVPSWAQTLYWREINFLITVCVYSDLKLFQLLNKSR
jgi:hypothetical protein